MSMAVIGVIGLAATLATTGYALAGGGQPSQPNLGASSAKMADTEATLLPELRAMQAAAQEGGSALRPGYTTSTNGDQLRSQLEAKIAELERLPDTVPGGKTAHPLPNPAKAALVGLQQQLAAIPAGSGETVYLDKKGNVVSKDAAVADFTGLSEADIQGKLTQEMAQGQLALSQKYDSKFIDAALAQEKLADPESFAAREKLFGLIEGQVGKKMDNPVADTLESQVMDRVNAGSNLTEDEKHLLAQTIADRAGGGGDAAADFSHEMTTGVEGSKRQMSNAMAGVQELAGGQTPEDIQYRADQQNLANLSNFIQGKTPEAEFRELSGASVGPTPMAGNPNLPTLPGNAGALGAAAAADRFGLQTQASANSASPWMAGLSSLLGLGKVAAAGGWKPFAPGP